MRCILKGANYISKNILKGANNYKNNLQKRANYDMLKSRKISWMGSMKRKALQDLVEWNKNKRRKPLIVWGARQVGKTYLIKEFFAQIYYKEQFLYIDCKVEDDIREFCSKTANAGKIIEYISLLKGRRITRDTLLIFDEVQECPNLVSALKYFCQDYPEIPVIATGSMVRIKIQRETHKRGVGESESFLFPVGKIDQLTIYPIRLTSS